MDKSAWKTFLNRQTKAVLVEMLLGVIEENGGVARRLQREYVDNLDEHVEEDEEEDEDEEEEDESEDEDEEEFYRYRQFPRY